MGLHIAEHKSKLPFEELIVPKVSLLSISVCFKDKRCT